MWWCEVLYRVIGEQQETQDFPAQSEEEVAFEMDKTSPDDLNVEPSTSMVVSSQTTKNLLLEDCELVVLKEFQFIWF